MDKVRIFGRDYRVIKCPLKCGDHYTLFGDTNYQKHIIRLNKDNCLEQDRETLLHEVFHVLSTLTGSNLTEKQVVAMSNGVFSVLRDNKKLLDG